LRWRSQVLADELFAGLRAEKCGKVLCCGAGMTAD
jgi:hypothetical protein